MMIMIGFGQDIKVMFAKASLPEMTQNRIKFMKRTLRLTKAAIMIAHGGFAAIEMNLSEWREELNEEKRPPGRAQDTADN